MKQFELQNNILRLRVKKAPVLIRIFLFLFAFLLFTGPLFGVITSAANGGGFHLGFFAVIFIFGLLGFYLLRNALWNTYGEELIQFNGHEISYEANYGWFKDGKKVVKIEVIHFSIRTIGYVDENLGMLIISNSDLNLKSSDTRQLDQITNEGDIKIESVVKMPIDQLEELIGLLESAVEMKA